MRINMAKAKIVRNHFIVRAFTIYESLFDDKGD